MTPPCSPNSRPASESAAIGLSAGGRAAASLAVVLALAACGTRDAEPHALVTPTTSEGTSESTSVSVAPGVDSPAEAPHTSGTGVDSDRGGDGAGRDDTGDAPEYTTDLALSVKEKEAADAAVTALEEYIAVSNEVFSSGGEGAEKFENVASDAVLLETQQTAADQREKGTVLEGEIFHVSQAVSYVDLEIDDDTSLPIVAIQGCVPAKAYRFSDAPELLEESVFEYIATEYEGDWFIAEQYLVGEKCD